MTQNKASNPDKEADKAFHKWYYIIVGFVFILFMFFNYLTETLK